MQTNISSTMQVVVPNASIVETGKTVLFISELPENITEQDLEIFFDKFLDSILLLQINRVNRVYTSLTPKTLTATAIFKEHSKAELAIKNLNLKKLRGKTIRIMWHEKDNNLRYNNQANIFVKNVHHTITPREFYEKFLTFGDIISAKMCEDEDGNHNGYGYVNYYHTESAEGAIKALNDQEVWGQKLEVQRFQKKNERNRDPHTVINNNKHIYVKNLPSRFTEKEVKDLFSKFGNITFLKLLEDNRNRKFSIISFDSEEVANKVKTEMNHLVVEENELYVETLMKKSDRIKVLSSRVNDKNFNLNSKYKNCNLHIRNIPQEVNEEYLNEEFSKYGEIRSVKIPKVILVTKVGNEFTENLMSKGFAYVCFVNAESAITVKDELNGKFLSRYENAKRPLLIDFFMAKYERQQLWSRIQQHSNPNSKMAIINPYTQGNIYGAPFNMHPTLAKHIKQPQPFMHPGNIGYTNTRYKSGKQYKQEQVVNQSIAHNNQNTSLYEIVRNDNPDKNYMNSLDDDALKKDYLGEFIFKKIENHPISQAHNFTIDNIGKITGMILGIEDIDEIFDITMNYENLSSRINEAISLLEQR